MKILGLINYSIDDIISNKGIRPRHLAYGLDYLLSHNELNIKSLRRGGKIIRHIYLIWYLLYPILFSWKFDVILSVSGNMVGWVGRFKAIGLVRKTKIYTFIHRWDKRNKINSGIDKMFFLSKEVMDIYKKEYPLLQDRMFYLEWGADLSFYQKVFNLKSEKSAQGNVLISTGKDHRDVNSFVKVSKELGVSSILITDKVQMCEKGKKVFANNVGNGLAMSHKEILSYMQKSNISVIPVSDLKWPGFLCGLTSLLDSLAMGMPIIMSDNTYITLNIEKKGMGLYYKAGDEKDMKEKIKSLLSTPSRIIEFGKNARIYAESHDYNGFCTQLEKHIISN